jgi:hypothetical protein
VAPDHEPVAACDGNGASAVRTAPTLVPCAMMSTGALRRV